MDNKKISIIDDDPGPQKTLSDILRAEGCDGQADVNGKRSRP